MDNPDAAPTCRLSRYTQVNLGIVDTAVYNNNINIVGVRFVESVCVKNNIRHECTASSSSYIGNDLKRLRIRYQILYYYGSWQGYYYSYNIIIIYRRMPSRASYFALTIHNIIIIL